MPSHNKNVILFPSTEKWTFLDYVDCEEENVIEKWLESQSSQAKYAFNKLLKQNAKVRNHLEWGGYRHKLKGKEYRKIFELEFSSDGRANRIMCVFDGVKRVVLLCGCYHKDKNWTPSNALELTLKRSLRVENGTAKFAIRTIRYDL